MSFPFFLKCDCIFLSRFDHRSFIKYLNINIKFKYRVICKLFWNYSNRIIYYLSLSSEFDKVCSTGISGISRMELPWMGTSQECPGIKEDDDFSSDSEAFSIFEDSDFFSISDCEDLLRRKYWFNIFPLIYVYILLYLYPFCESEHLIEKFLLDIF